MKIQQFVKTSAVLSVIAALILVPTPTYAKTLDDAMNSVARGLGNQLRKAGAKRVQVKMDGPASDGASTKMRASFISALEKQANVTVTSKLPDFKLTLEYARADNSSDYSATVTLKDSKNQSVGKFPVNFEFDDIGDRVAIEGATADATLSTTGTEQPATKSNITEKLNAKREVFVEPKPGLPPTSEGTTPVGSIVSPQQQSKFRIEVLVRPGGTGTYVPRGIESIDGFAFCELGEGDVYGVKVYNDAEHAVAVDLSIDGINMWHTSKVPGFKQLGKFVVGPRSNVFMRGWHVGGPDPGSIHDYANFRIVEFPDSLVAEIGADQSAVGQISAQFFAASQSPTLPSVEPIGHQGPGTALGEVSQHETKVEPWFIGKSLLAAVTIRYARPDPIDLPLE